MSDTDTAPTETKKQRKQRFFQNEAEHRQKVLALRRKWIAEHPNPMTGPVPERPWGGSNEAARGAPWWGVKRLGPYGNAYHGEMFRHPTEESAAREAEWLASSFPGTVFVVLALVSVHSHGEPEVTLT